MSITLAAVVSLSCSMTTRDLNAYAKEFDAPVFVTQEVDLRTHSGFVPATLYGKDAGVETYYEEGAKILEMLPKDFSVDADSSGVVLFRFGSRAEEAATALYIAYALSKKCGAALFDDQSGKYMSAEMAKETAKFFVETSDHEWSYRFESSRSQ